VVQISVWIPYDEDRLRRTLRFIARPQVKLIRILGAVLLVLGIALVALEPTSPIAYGFVALGLLFVFAIGPITVAWSMRVQSKVIKDGFRLTLDEDWLTVTYPLVETRLRWAGLDRIVETPEAWYALFGKLQGFTIPKDPMTEEQQAVFAAFLGRLGSGGRTASQIG
jgi:hypothetical protein